MSNALQTVSSNNAIATKDLLSGQDLEVLRKSKFKGFEDHEIAFCARICSHLQLNPMLNQIHFVRRKSKDGGHSISTQVGIDGFRLAAQRTGGYAGSDDATFDDEKNPTKATVTVYRIVSGVRCAFTASARWDEYCPAPPSDAMWKKMPNVMLAKCAEALALRKAFPQELAGVRSDEEMMRAEDAPESKASLLNKRAPMKDISESAIEAESHLVEEPMPPPAPAPKQSLESMANRKFPFWAGYKGRSYIELGEQKLEMALSHIEKLPNPPPEAIEEAKHIVAYLNALEHT